MLISPGSPFKCQRHSLRVKSLNRCKGALNSMAHKFIFLSIALMLLEGCGGALISNRQERSIGRGVHAEIKAEYALVSSKDPVAQWAKEFIKPLEKASAPFRDPAEVRGYKIAVIADDTLVNAFAAPGGYTYLSTGLILKAKTCAEIAGVMGHELAHITQRHGAKSLEKGVAAQELIGLFLEDGLAANSASVIWGFLQATTFSREDETEADRVGLRVTYRAGYTPYGLADFFATLLKSEGSGGPEFLSSHPATSKRVRSVRSQIKRRYGKKAKKKSSACLTRLKLSELKARIRSGKMKTNGKVTPAKATKKKATASGWKKGKSKKATPPATKGGWRRGSKTKVKSAPATKSGWKKGSPKKESTP
jgi:predicted Zn-dependent protease